MSKTDQWRGPCEAWFLWTLAAPVAPLTLLEHIETLFVELDVRPSRILAVSTIGDLNRRRFSMKALVAVGSLPNVGTVIVMNGEKEPPMEVALYLRDGDGAVRSEAGRFERPVSIRAVDRLRSREPALRFLARATELYRVAHGGGIRARDRNHASAEIDLVSTSSELAPGEGKRKHFDAMHVREAHRHLRRLYPVTIIGPEIWATLPPLPALEVPPTVTDLGNCKMLTAWPELCDPRDPAFLRDTVALREWLWPHTIQNPADHIDEDPYEYGQS